MAAPVEVPEHPTGKLDDAKCYNLSSNNVPSDKVELRVFTLDGWFLLQLTFDRVRTTRSGWLKADAVKTCILKWKDTFAKTDDHKKYLDTFVITSEILICDVILADGAGTSRTSIQTKVPPRHRNVNPVDINVWQAGTFLPNDTKITGRMYVDDSHSYTMALLSLTIGDAPEIYDEWRQYTDYEEMGIFAEEVYDKWKNKHATSDDMKAHLSAMLGAVKRRLRNGH